MSPPPRIPFRQFADQHIQAAKSLLSSGPREQVYACLELRLAIEALVYDTLQTYAEDRGDSIDSAMKEWHPKAVLDHLLSHDPFADQSLKMVMRLRPIREDGTKGEPVFHEATDARFDVQWAAKAHRSLSSFLHQPTIARLKKSGPIDHKTLCRKANEVITRLEVILASKIPNARLDLRFGYPCPSCGSDISVAVIPLLKGVAKTTCAACKTEWNVDGHDEAGQPKVILRSEHQSRR